VFFAHQPDSSFSLGIGDIIHPNWLSVDTPPSWAARSSASGLPPRVYSIAALPRCAREYAVCNQNLYSFDVHYGERSECPARGHLRATTGAATWFTPVTATQPAVDEHHIRSPLSAHQPYVAGLPTPLTERPYFPAD